MTKDQFNAWIKKHGLTIEEAAAVLGMSRANAFKYANGSAPVALYIEYATENIDLMNKNERIKLIQERLDKVSSQSSNSAKD